MSLQGRLSNTHASTGFPVDPSAIAHRLSQVAPFEQRFTKKELHDLLHEEPTKIW
jgi:hypothetical protein